MNWGLLPVFSVIVWLRLGRGPLGEGLYFAKGDWKKKVPLVFGSAVVLVRVFAFIYTVFLEPLFVMQTKVDLRVAVPACGFASRFTRF